MYTAVNNSTGELMAMKEIAIQPGETRAIRNVAEELKIFEGISHKHLVKLYGVEIHRVSAGKVNSTTIDSDAFVALSCRRNC